MVRCRGIRSARDGSRWHEQTICYRDALLQIGRAPEQELATQSHICDPSVRLSPYIEAYWSRAASDDRRAMRVLPDASTYLIFELTGELAGSAYLVGTLLSPVVVNLNGEVDRVGIRFRPGMAGLLFNVSARNLRDRVLDLNDAGIRLPGSLLDDLMEVPDFRSRVRVIEHWLLGRLSALESSVQATRTETAQLFHAIMQGAYPRVIGDLMAWNERKVQRVFQERFGASAATLRRWGRFRRCLAVLEGEEYRSRAIASAQLGYSDQAHMCREFREFSGTDIGSLLSERRSVGNVQAAGQQNI